MKRFYRSVTVERVEGGYAVALDGRQIRTQGEGLPQTLPTRTLADLLAQEWSRQGEAIDLSGFPARALADYAIDRVTPDRGAAADRLMRFIDTDTLCFRADPEEPLHRRQMDVWEPILTRFEQRTGSRLVRVSGVMHRPQPAATLAALKTQLLEWNAFALAGLETLASLAASLTVALEVAEPGADAAALWAAAALEEEWQAELWGREAEAESRRARRRIEFMAARDFVLAARAA
ncbi:ATP12 family protein [Porphyrobacter sp. GA68]|uniref:ATP12 family protein n=1 Tax=Porphyrobacter sp. GA68 TaxID=2883480 RepID=UPI001D180331|nr:ATP12 family protein [Porphyrobacter sp. GA68]